MFQVLCFVLLFELSLIIVSYKVGYYQAHFTEVRLNDLSKVACPGE